MISMMMRISNVKFIICLCVPMFYWVDFINVQPVLKFYCLNLSVCVCMTLLCGKCSIIVRFTNFNHATITVKDVRPVGLPAIGNERHGVQGSPPVSEGCDHYHPLLLPWLSFGRALRYLTPTGRVPQLTNPSCCTRGRFQAAESQPRRDYRKLWQPTNYDRCYAKVHCKLRRRVTSLCPMEIYHAAIHCKADR